MQSIQTTLQETGRSIKHQIDTSEHLPSRTLKILFVIWVPFALLAAASALGFLLELVTYHIHFLLGFGAAFVCWFLLHRRDTVSRKRIEIAILISAVLPILMLVISPYLRIFTLIAFCGTPYIVSVHFLHQTEVQDEYRPKKKKAKNSDDEADSNSDNDDAELKKSEPVPEKKPEPESAASDNEKFYDSFLLYAVATSVIFLVSSGGETSIMASCVLAGAFGLACFAATLLIPIVKPQIPLHHIHDYPELLFIALQLLLGNVILTVFNFTLTPATAYQEFNPWWLTIFWTLVGVAILLVGFIVQGRIIVIPALQERSTRVMIHSIFSGAIFGAYLFLAVVLLCRNWIVTKYVLSFLV